MQVNDIDFTTAASLLLRIEANAGLEDYSLSRVNSYRVTSRGLAQKQKIIVVLRSNRSKLADWAKRAKISDVERVLLRSLYNQYTVMIKTCEAHAEIIAATLEGQLECV